MSLIDDFMSQVVDLDEKEKEETILFLATALQCGDPHVVKNISRKVTILVMPFLVEVLLKGLARYESKMEGGEKVEKDERSIRLGEESKEV